MATDVPSTDDDDQNKPDPLNKPGGTDNTNAIGECTYPGCKCKNFMGGYQCSNCKHGNSWHL